MEKSSPPTKRWIYNANIKLFPLLCSILLLLLSFSVAFLLTFRPLHPVLFAVHLLSNYFTKEQRSSSSSKVLASASVHIIFLPFFLLFHTLLMHTHLVTCSAAPFNHFSLRIAFRPFCTPTQKESFIGKRSGGEWWTGSFLQTSSTPGYCEYFGYSNFRGNFTACGNTKRSFSLHHYMRYYVPDSHSLSTSPSPSPDGTWASDGRHGSAWQLKANFLFPFGALPHLFLIAYGAEGQ